MSDVEQDRALALAGLLQSACLADQLAATGRAPSAEFGALLGSLFGFDPRTTPEIFAGAAGVRLGLETVDQRRGPVLRRRGDHGARRRAGIGIAR